MGKGRQPVAPSTRMEVPMTTHSETRSEAAVAAAPAPEIAQIPSWLAFALGGAALLALWLVSFDNGQLTSVLDNTGSFAHELFHDGRHLLGVPCH